MSDFSKYKALKLSEVSSNANLSSNGVVPTGAQAVIAQSCRREQYFKLANLSAATAANVVAEAKTVAFTGTLATANLTCLGVAASSGSAYTSVNLVKYTASSNYASSVLMATANLANVAVSAFTPIAFTLVSNAANYQVAAGDVVAANIVLTSTGTANNLSAEVDYVVEDV